MDIEQIKKYIRRLTTEEVGEIADFATDLFEDREYHDEDEDDEIETYLKNF